MNDRYAGDVGDFSKLGLLRLLARSGKRPLKVGLLWYATSEAGGAEGDGRHVDYLTGTRRAEFAALDPELHRALTPFARSRRRTIVELERVTRSLLPGIAFHRTPVDFRPGTSRAQRLDFRAGWLDEAASVARQTELICVDPDNGLASASAERSGRTSKQARKLIFLDEVRRLVGPAQSLVLYHHQTRIGDKQAQARQLSQRLSGALPWHLTPRVLRFTAYSSRFYVLVASRAHAWLVEDAIPRLTRSWAPHFEQVS